MMRRFAPLALLLAAACLLQGCFPAAVVATGAAVSIATDRRTTGIYIEDENIELKSLGVLREKRFEPVHVNGEFQPRTMMPLSLSYDHRLIDGADAIRFLRWVCDALEQSICLDHESSPSHMSGGAPISPFMYAIQAYPRG